MSTKCAYCETNIKGKIEKTDGHLLCWYCRGVYKYPKMSPKWIEEKEKMLKKLNGEKSIFGLYGEEEMLALKIVNG